MRSVAVMAEVPELERRPSRDFVLVDGNTNKLIVSDYEKKGDFVLVHESPVSQRRELRASKELNEDDKAALAALVVGVPSDVLEVPADEEPPTEAANDEEGVVVMPSPQRRPSFYKGGEADGCWMNRIEISKFI